jgi:hypothetical protein
VVAGARGSSGGLTSGFRQVVRSHQDAHPAQAAAGLRVVHDPREHFALANHHMLEADERIAAQRQRIERRRQAGYDTGDSEDLLRYLLKTRELMSSHQEQLEREMAEWRTLHPEE